jgi:acylphosphatase
MKKHFNLRIKGKVQGVWFRASTLQKARALSLCGFVRNEPNGEVYVEVEGEHPALTTFFDWCKKGPELARVDDVQLEEQPLQHFTTFEIIR